MAGHYREVLNHYLHIYTCSCTNVMYGRPTLSHTWSFNHAVMPHMVIGEWALSDPHLLRIAGTTMPSSSPQQTNGTGRLAPVKKFPWCNFHQASKFHAVCACTIRKTPEHLHSEGQRFINSEL